MEWFMKVYINWFVCENVEINNIFKAFWPAIANIGSNLQNRQKFL